MSQAQGLTPDPELLSISKVLSANDCGLTGSHQAGIYVPDTLAWFFPSLMEDQLNPKCWMDCQGQDGRIWTFRFIHYNNGIVGCGTRSEYRLTRVAGYISYHALGVGDIIEFEQSRTGGYRVSHSAAQPTEKEHTLKLRGHWRVFTY
jgi:hypothetical protein